MRTIKIVLTDANEAYPTQFDVMFYDNNAFIATITLSEREHLTWKTIHNWIKNGIIST
jgi:hypothetical protein